MISVSNLTKGFQGEELLKDVSFVINNKEKIGLLGRNGSGKTTLMKILTNEETGYRGEIQISQNHKLGYLKQINIFKNKTVLQECMEKLSKDLDESWKVKKILSGLGFSEGDFERSPNDFSGGYQMRIALTKVLVSDPDLLLLDEPTNYLDITSIRWLEGFLRSWKRELLLITHDRTFMDKVCTHVMGIHRMKLKKMKGGTQKYFDFLEQYEKDFENKRVNEERKRKKMEDFISKFRAKARQANLAQSRLKALNKQIPQEKLQKITTLSFNFNEADLPPKYFLKTSNVAFSYSGDTPFLFEKFNLDVTSGDRIGVIGKNGKGKSSLMKLLAGKLSPIKGSIKKQPNILEAFFNQDDAVLLNDDFSIEEEIFSALSSKDRKKARDIAGSMMFPGDNALKKIKVLSGGEKCRVVLGKVLAKPANFLLLDEPSHHLDIFSCKSLIWALKNFNGAFIIITHDERFLHELVNKLIVFKGDNPFVFQGTYKEYLEKYGWDETYLSEDKSDACYPKKTENIESKKLQKKMRAELVAKRSKFLHPLKKQIEIIENKIMEKENNSTKINNELVKASQDGQGKKIVELSKELTVLNKNIEKMYQDLYKMSEEYEKLDQELSLENT